MGLYVFGTSVLAMNTVAELFRHKIVPDGFIVDKQYKEYDEVEIHLTEPDGSKRTVNLLVSTPEEIHKSDTIYMGTMSPATWKIPDRLKADGFTDVLTFPELLGKFPTFFPSYFPDMPDKTRAEKEEAAEALELFNEPRSRVEYQAMWDFRAGKIGALEACTAVPYPNGEVYWPEDLIDFQSGRYKTFVDCGAYTGDTLKHALKYPFVTYLELEPDPANLKKLLRYWISLDRDYIKVFPMAVSDKPGYAQFSSGLDCGMGARLNNQGDIWVNTIDLDTFLRPYEGPYYIKLDIEGAEMAALTGAKNLLRDCTSTLAVCVYHTYNDLWQVPLLIDSLSLGGYEFYLRSYVGLFDTIVYAIPRCKRTG